MDTSSHLHLKIERALKSYQMALHIILHELPQYGTRYDYAADAYLPVTHEGQALTVKDELDLLGKPYSMSADIAYSDTIMANLENLVTVLEEWKKAVVTDRVFIQRFYEENAPAIQILAARVQGDLLRFHSVFAENVEQMKTILLTPQNIADSGVIASRNVENLLAGIQGAHPDLEKFERAFSSYMDWRQTHLDHVMAIKANPLLSEFQYGNNGAAAAR